MNNSSDLMHLELNGKPMGYLLMSLNIIAFFPIVIGNILVLTAYKKTPKLRAPINLLLVNLAITDLCTGFFSIPWTILGDYLELEVDKDKYFCLLGYPSRHVPLGVSCLTMLCIGTVRAISVFNPLKSRSIITHERIKLAMASVWLYLIGLVFGYVFLYHRWSPDTPCDMKVVLGNTYTMILGAHMALVGVISTCFYIAFLLSVQKTRRKTAAYAIRSAVESEDRTTWMVMSVVGCFYLCWAPALIYIIVRLIIFTDTAESYWGNVVEHFTLLICFCNSFMNPFIYAGYNRTFKKAFLKYLKIFFCIKEKTTTSLKPQKQILTEHV